MSRTIQLSRTGRNIATFFEDQNAWFIFAALCLGYATTSYIQDTFIVTKEVYYNSLGEQLTMDRIDTMLERQTELKFVSYLFLPFIIVLKATIVALCLNCGMMMINYPIHFGSLLKLVLRSSIVFLIGKLALTCILLFSTIQTFDDLVATNKFAITGFIDKANIPTWLMYPLSTLNVFELAFWLLLTAGISSLLEKSFKVSLGFVAMTYGLGLLIWMTFIVFLQLNLS